MGTVPVQNKTFLQMDYQVGTCMFGVWAPRFPAVGSYQVQLSLSQRQSSSKLVATISIVATIVKKRDDFA